MFYITTALKSEAQAFIEKNKLKKSKLNDFTTYFNKEMIIIVSGIGVINARNATQSLIDNFDIEDKDIYLNIGICASDKKYNIGELIEIGSITYNNITYKFKNASNINCLDNQSDDISYKIVDMESYGFYDAVIHSPAIKHFHILKVVSDNFEPEKVTKDKTKMLIFNKIDEIKGKI